MALDHQGDPENQGVGTDHTNGDDNLGDPVDQGQVVVMEDVGNDADAMIAF